METWSEKMEGKYQSMHLKKIHLKYLQIDFQNYNIGGIMIVDYY